MWQEKDQKLCATFTFADFQEAFTFMTRVAFIAEHQQHHPNWTNVWNRVEIQLSTHDAGDIITEKDHQLAAAITAVYAQYAGK